MDSKLKVVYRARYWTTFHKPQLLITESYKNRFNVLHYVLYTVRIMDEKTPTQKWIEDYFKETWKEVETDIDFSKYEPISTSNSLHIFEERYKIDDNTYRLLYAIGYDGEPSIEVLT